MLLGTACSCVRDAHPGCGCTPRSQVAPCPSAQLGPRFSPGVPDAPRCSMPSWVPDFPWDWMPPGSWVMLGTQCTAGCQKPPRVLDAPSYWMLLQLPSVPRSWMPPSHPRCHQVPDAQPVSDSPLGAGCSQVPDTPSSWQPPAHPTLPACQTSPACQLALVHSDALLYSAGRREQREGCEDGGRSIAGQGEPCWGLKQLQPPPPDNCTSLRVPTQPCHPL